MKRSSFSTTVAAVGFALAVTAIPAAAQTSGTTSRATDMVDINKLIGEDVNTPSGEKIGDIETVVLDKSGKVKYAVVGVGGFLGAGEKNVALPWKDLKVDVDGKTITSTVSKDQIKSMPEYRYSDASMRGTIFTDKE